MLSVLTGLTSRSQVWRTFCWLSIFSTESRFTVFSWLPLMRKSRYVRHTSLTPRTYLLSSEVGRFSRFFLLTWTISIDVKGRWKIKISCYRKFFNIMQKKWIMRHLHHFLQEEAQKKNLFRLIKGCSSFSFMIVSCLDGFRDKKKTMEMLWLTWLWKSMVTTK